MKKKQKPFIKNLKNFTPVGHRGAGGEIPGNTIESFRHLVNVIPGSMLELDVWKSADNKIVVYHDEYLQYETDGEGNIIQYNYSDIIKIDRGYRVTFDNGNTHPFRGRGYKIPMLSQVLEEFPDSAISIDIKYHDTNFAASVVSLIRNFNAFHRVIFGSFSGKIIKYIKSTFPDIAISFNKYEVIKFSILNKTGLNKHYNSVYDMMMIPEVISLQGEVPEDEYDSRGYRLITKTFIQRAKESGIPVFAWTINKKENMRRLISWGINGIVTDYPTILKKVMDEMGVGS